MSRDYELGTKFRLIVFYLLRKNTEIEVSAFGSFSTDTGSTDCNQVFINVFRFRRSRPSVPHGTNFLIYCNVLFLNYYVSEIS